MSILGIGVDILHVTRLAALIHRKGSARLAARILSPQEHTAWTACTTPQRSTQFLAVRWAVKEAAYKALYPLVRLTWKELSYKSADDSSGRKPSLVFHSNVEEGGGRIGRLHVSVSHDGEYVFAQVLAEHPG